MSRLQIVADSNILSVKSSFEDFADVHLIPGREISREDLAGADALLVRSITRVDEELLQGTRIRFVGSATSGTDHIDLKYLNSREIHFADARGSNANAVVEYCFSAIAYAIFHRNLNPYRCKVGLVGAGQVGRRFAQKLKLLGIDYRVCDPPLLEQLRAGGVNSAPRSSSTPESFVPPTSKFCSLEEILNCDIISLHVPLVLDGKYPTNRLIGKDELDQLKPEAMFMNTCRGSVVYEPALLHKLQETDGITCVIDVWENEPEVSSDLVRIADIATPHIAGYSYDAKLVATQLLLRELRNYFELPAAVAGQPEAGASPKTVSIESRVNAEWRSLLTMLPLTKLSEDFKKSSRQGNVAIQFDAMRKRLLDRREFPNYAAVLDNLSTEQQLLLRALGLQSA